MAPLLSESIRVKNPSAKKDCGQEAWRQAQVWTQGLRFEFIHSMCVCTCTCVYCRVTGLGWALVVIRPQSHTRVQCPCPSSLLRASLRCKGRTIQSPAVRMDLCLAPGPGHLCRLSVPTCHHPHQPCSPDLWWPLTQHGKRVRHRVLLQALPGFSTPFRVCPPVNPGRAYRVDVICFLLYVFRLPTAYN